MIRTGAQWLLMLMTLAAVSVGSPEQAKAQFFNGELYIGHGIPGDELDTPMTDIPNALPIDVCVGVGTPLNCVYSGMTFGTFRGPLSLSPGVYQVEISLANPDAPGTNPPVLSGIVAVRPFQSFTFMAHLGTDGLPMGTTFQNSPARIATGKSRVVVRQTANLGSVDFSLKTPLDAPGTAVLGLSNSRQSGPSELAAGPYVARVNPAGQPGTNLITPLPVVLAPLNAYYFYTVGSAESGTLQLLQQRIPLKRRWLP